MGIDVPEKLEIRFFWKGWAVKGEPAQFFQAGEQFPCFLPGNAAIRNRGRRSSGPVFDLINKRKFGVFVFLDSCSHLLR